MRNITLIPTLLIMIFTLVLHLPIFLPHYIILPDLILITLFFCCLFQKSILFYVFAILIGITNDYLQGNVIGISALNYSILIFVINHDYNSLRQQKFLIIWIVFAVFMTISTFLTLSANLLFLGYWGLNIRMLIQAIVTLCCYPLLHNLYYKHLMKKENLNA